MDIISVLAENNRNKKAQVLCLLTETTGSTPRKAGSVMIVADSGEIAGSVGGGDLEYCCQQKATQVLKEQRSTELYYRLNAVTAEEQGMICGGTATIHLYYLPAAESVTSLLSQAAAALNNQETQWFCLSQTEYNALPELVSEITAAELCPPKQRKCRAYFRLDGKDYLRLSNPGTLWLFGAGHVAQALCPILSALEFEVVVYDSRPDFANWDYFPTAQKIICAPFEEISDRVSFQKEDVCVIMTNGHAYDYLAEKAALASEMKYIGVIGSHKKAAALHQRLLKDGFTEDSLARVHSPVGLAIGAQTPAEIGISIAAQLIQHRAATE